MRKLLYVTIAFLLAGSIVSADWAPPDPYKMHFPQFPDPVGWDVNATQPLVLADDWMCSETGPVTDIHFWGSWMHGIPGMVQGFWISIHADVPAGPGVPFSHPGPTLWEEYITNFVTTPPIDPPGQQGWYDPQTGMVFPNDHDPYFQYNITGISNPFIQQQGNIYWLNISAQVANPGATQWGWKSTTNHWQDDAVWALWGQLIWDDIYQPPDFTQSLDLAFVITGGQQDIPTLTEWGMIVLALLLLAAGTVAIIRRRALALKGAK